jgi:hypothetical protein
LTGSRSKPPGGSVFLTSRRMHSGGTGGSFFLTSRRMHSGRTWFRRPDIPKDAFRRNRVARRLPTPKGRDPANRGSCRHHTPKGLTPAETAWLVDSLPRRVETRRTDRPPLGGRRRWCRTEVPPHRLRPERPAFPTSRPEGSDAEEQVVRSCTGAAAKSLG